MNTPGGEAARWQERRQYWIDQGEDPILAGEWAWQYLEGLPERAPLRIITKSRSRGPDKSGFYGSVLSWEGRVDLVEDLGLPYIPAEKEEKG